MIDIGKGMIVILWSTVLIPEKILNSNSLIFQNFSRNLVLFRG
jgi:hypothetical protein